MWGDWYGEGGEGKLGEETVGSGGGLCPPHIVYRNASQLGLTSQPLRCCGNRARGFYKGDGVVQPVLAALGQKRGGVWVGAVMTSATSVSMEYPIRLVCHGLYPSPGAYLLVIIWRVGHTQVPSVDSALTAGTYKLRVHQPSPTPLLLSSTEPLTTPYK